jgi:hypothetical protein
MAKKKTTKKKVVRKKTAKKKTTKKKAVKRLKPLGRVVTIKQITDALYGIENWCRSLREILLVLPPGMKITVFGKGAQGSTSGSVPQVLDYGCPPPPPPADGGPGLDYGCPPPEPEA